MKERINIGLLVDDLDNYFTAQCCYGAEIAAKELDADLYIIPGRYIGRPDGRYGTREYTYQYNTAFKLISERNIDILYVLVGTICSRADEDEMRSFVESLPKVPTVFLFSNYEGYNTVNFDNRSGIRAEVRHLYEKHNARRIGYVSGPVSNRDAVIRLEAFLEICDTLGIEEQDRPIVYGDFTNDSADAVNSLLDNNDKLDAIVFANDRMAMGGYEVLYSRGLTPGDDILVVGFDDDVVSKSMIPPLTTVETNSADVTYQAIMNTDNYIRSQTPTDISTKTNLIQRRSCGCRSYDYKDMLDRIGISPREARGENLTEAVGRYVFGVFHNADGIENTKNALNACLMAYEGYIESSCDSESEVLIKETFGDFIKTDYAKFTSSEKLFNILKFLQYRAYSFVEHPDLKVRISELFSDLYRDIAFTNVRFVRQEAGKRDELERLMNRQSGEITVDPNTEYIPYKVLLTDITKMGFKSMYLYFFQGSSTVESQQEWRCPNTVLLKVFCDENGTYEIREEQQLMRTELIFANEYIPDDVRHTMIALPVFIGNEIYGVLVTEADCSDMALVTPVAQQMSITIRSLIILDAQNKTRRELQETLEKFMQDNTMLDEIAKSDELTGLFNRRGFLNNAERIIKDPENEGKLALVCYADMDNLKMVNDRYGHDEGDFAIRQIATVLREAFRTNDVIGRIGGDEFVALAMVGSDGAETAIKPRIQKLVEEHDAESGKPYTISVSTGFHTFRCGPDVDIYEMLDMADSRLYVEKQEKKKKNGSYR